MRNISKQALRYLGAFAVINVLVGGGIGAIMGWYGFGAIAIGNASLVPVLILKFFIYKYWVFQDKLPKWIAEPGWYLVIVGAGYLLFLALQYMAQLFGLTEWYAFAVAGAIIGVLRFFFFRRVFAVPEPPAA